MRIQGKHLFVALIACSLPLAGFAQTSPAGSSPGTSGGTAATSGAGSPGTTSGGNSGSGSVAVDDRSRPFDTNRDGFLSPEESARMQAAQGTTTGPGTTGTGNTTNAGSTATGAGMGPGAGTSGQSGAGGANTGR